MISGLVSQNSEGREVGLWMGKVDGVTVSEARWWVHGVGSFFYCVGFLCVGSVRARVRVCRTVVGWLC